MSENTLVKRVCTEKITGSSILIRLYYYNRFFTFQLSCETFFSHLASLNEAKGDVHRDPYIACANKDRDFLSRKDRGSPPKS